MQLQDSEIKTTFCYLQATCIGDVETAVLSAFEEFIHQWHLLLPVPL